METYEVTKSGLKRYPSVGPIPGGNKVPWLLAIVFVILATGVTLFILHMSITYKNISEETRLLLSSKTASLQGNQCQKHFCDTKDCVRMASRILDFMNSQADPCADFYEFACGGFKKSRSIPYAHHTYTPVTESHHSILRDIKNVMENKSNHHESQTLMKLKQLYKSCTDTGRRNNFAVQSLEYWLSDIEVSLSGQNSEDSIYLNSEGSWRKIVRRLEEFRIHTVVKPTFKSTSFVPIETIQLDCVMLTLPISTYFHSTENENAYLLNMYKRVIYLVLYEMKMNETIIKEFVNDVIRMETDIAFAVQNSRFSATSEISKEHIQQMKELWRVMLGDIVQDINIVSTCKYSLEDILNTLNKAPPQRSSRYVVWRMLSQILQYTGGEFRKLHFNFLSKWSARNYAFDSPWEECSDVLREELGSAVYKALMDSGYLKKERTQEINDAVKGAKSYLIRVIRGAEWIDITTSKALISKIKEMKLNPGFSEWMEKSETIDTVFEGLNLEDDYFNSVMNIKKFKTRHALNRLWYSDPETPNSEISLDDNSLEFSSKFDYDNNIVRIDHGLLRPPVVFLSKSIPKYLKYGEISVLMQEMSHSIDATGIFQDSGMNEEMTSVLQRYDSYFGCLINQTLNIQTNIYPEFYKTQLLNDMIADMGSFRFAYRGMIMYLRANKMAEYKLPGVLLTKEQTYFTQVAQRYCNLKGDMSPNSDDGNDIPMRLRVNIAVSNMESFGNAFNCPSNSSLNPKTKCKLF